MRLLVLVLGCGFHGIANIDVDSGADLISLENGVDLAGADLAGAPDLAQPATTGPGPLGALPAGFCCNSDAQCRSRHCIGATPSYCSDSCRDDAVCTAWGPGFICDIGSDTCVRSTASGCIDPGQYTYGSQAIGTCCSHGFPKAGQECLGGLCESTGNDANPFYCTQGCTVNNACPGGYSCFANFCAITQSLGDPNYLYMCQ
jgi:hypothetical protein